MIEVLLIILIALVLIALGLLAALWKQRRGVGVGGAGVEEDLRARLEAAQAARIQAETRLEAERKNLADQKHLLDDAEA
ncbi:MAG TPA: hypothetical protein VMY69_02655, partial [Phycisphaerae bacterium]|nr:hypothetical protein [Phycisphaerae bacterium]